MLARIDERRDTYGIDPIWRVRTIAQ